MTTIELVYSLNYSTPIFAKENSCIFHTRRYLTSRNIDTSAVCDVVRFISAAERAWETTT